MKRIIQQGKGQKKEVEGIIMSIDHDQLEVYWDTLDGIYCPKDIREVFTICNFEEVLYGTQKYSPIRLKKSISI